MNNCANQRLFFFLRQCLDLISFGVDDVCLNILRNNVVSMRRGAVCLRDGLALTKSSYASRPLCFTKNINTYFLPSTYLITTHIIFGAIDTVTARNYSLYSRSCNPSRLHSSQPVFVVRNLRQT